MKVEAQLFNCKLRQDSCGGPIIVKAMEKYASKFQMNYHCYILDINLERTNENVTGLI